MESVELRYKPDKNAIKCKYKSAVAAMQKFFQNKFSYLKEPIPKDKLYTKQNLKIVANLDIMAACDIAYATLASKSKPRDLNSKGVVGWDVELILSLIREMKSLGIINEFRGGLILLYLKFCRGYTIVGNRRSNSREVPDRRGDSQN